MRAAWAGHSPTDGTLPNNYYLCKTLIIYFRVSAPYFLATDVFRTGTFHCMAGIATRYGLDGSGIESRWGRDFPHPSRPALWSTQPALQWVPGLSRG